MFLSSYGRWISPTCERVEVYAVSGCTSPTKRNYFKKTSHGDLGLLDFRSKCLITNVIQKDFGLSFRQHLGFIPTKCFLQLSNINATKEYAHLGINKCFKSPRHVRRSKTKRLSGCLVMYFE